MWEGQLSAKCTARRNRGSTPGPGRAIEPRAYRFLLDFAGDNGLVVIDPTRPEGSADYCPVPGVTLGPGGLDAPGG